MGSSEEKEKFGMERNGGILSCPSSNIPLDWRFGGSNPVISRCLAPPENSCASSCSSVSMADSFSSIVWDHPSSQNSEFCSNNFQTSSSISEAVPPRNADHGFLRPGGMEKVLNVDWNNPYSIPISGGFLQPGTSVLPHNVPCFPMDSAFIGRAPKFSCFSDFSNMTNPFSSSGSLDPFNKAGVVHKPGVPSSSGLDVSGTQFQNGDPEMAQVLKDGVPVDHEVMEGCFRRSGENGGFFTPDDEGKCGIGAPGSWSEEAEISGSGDQELSVLENFDAEPLAKAMEVKERKRQNQVRREKISERMKFLQDLVPGCNKVTGKAVMLDEIINYVQSLKRQVEFLSMKLSAVNPQLDFYIEELLSKNVFLSHGCTPSSMGMLPNIGICHPQLHPLQQGLVQGAIPSTGSHSDLLRRTISSPLTTMNGYREPAHQDVELEQKKGSLHLSAETAKEKIESKEDEQNLTSVANMTSRKVSKDSSQNSDAPKQDYIHVRARQGRVTDSHSLAERVRRGKISERMKFLQDLVPGCNKVTGKAVMLDEIINYVQSLQRQVEFLSMKLAAVNPQLVFNIEELLSKNVFQSHGCTPSSMGMLPNIGISHPQLHTLQQGLVQGAIPSTGSHSDLLRTTISSPLTTMNGYREPAHQLPSSLAFEGIQMEDFTSEMQGFASSIDPPPEAEESRGTSVFVEIENLDKTWLDSIKTKVGVEPKRLKASSTSYSCSIHRVPHRLQHHDEKIRVPQIISIGPFHYDKRKDRLQAMEEHKWRYLHDILARNGDDCLERCLMAIKEVENEARECYSEEVELDSNSFVEMLLIDACFIIELFRRKWFEPHQGDDPVLDLDWLKCDLVIDLMMLENQIPFFVLELLSNLMNVSEPSPVEGALDFFCRWGSITQLGLDRRISHPKPKIHHLLHLLHTNLVYTNSIYGGYNGESLIACASKLREAGIRFKKRNGAHKFLHIKFQNGVIEIPPFTIENSRAYPIFFNLVAFEHSYCHCKKDITAYTIFMDGLINTATDVEILCPKIINWLGSNEEAAAPFNSIGREAIIPRDFYLSNVVTEINQYYGKFYPRMRATLKHDYCRTPCAITSIFAAIFLLFLTLGQIFFSAFPKFALQKNGN